MYPSQSKTCPHPQSLAQSSAHCVRLLLTGCKRCTVCTSSASKTKECAHKSETVLRGRGGRIFCSHHILSHTENPTHSSAAVTALGAAA